MSDVSCRACEPILRACRESGQPLEPLLRGLSIDVAQVERATNRIPWDDFTVLLERAADRFGGMERLKELGAAHSADPATGLLRALARSFSSARPLYVLGARWYGRSFFSNTRATLEDLPGGRLREVVEIPPPYRDSPEFFHVVWGVLEAAPTLLKQPPAVVEMELQPRRAVYTIALPPGSSWLGALRRRLRGHPSMADALAELNFQQAQLEEALQRERIKTAQLEAEILERQRTERQLQQAQKMEAVGLLAGGLAHEFSNILTAIGVYAEMCGEIVPPPALDHVREIGVATERGAAVIKRLLAFSRRQMVHPEPLDANVVIAELSPMLRAMLGETIQLDIKAADSLEPVLIDPGQLEQVIVNLAVNARDAMPDGGRLTIETSLQEGGSGSTGEGGQVQIDVRDTGVGMDADTCAQIFDPFFTTKPRGRGTGLGLFAAYGIVSQSGGTIDVESRVGQGTRLTLRLPGSVAAPTYARPLAESTALPEGSETLLVVEDDEQVRSIARVLLEATGYRVLAATHGEQALELAAEHEGPIDLVVADVVMPGMDGRELMRFLLPMRPEIRRVLFVSGHARRTPDAESLPVEHAFLRKPFSRRALLRAVRRLLDRPD